SRSGDVDKKAMNPYNNPVNPFKLSKTYIHIALQRVAARLTLHDLTSETPFRICDENFNFYDLNKGREEIISFLNEDGKMMLGESRISGSLMANLGYSPVELKKKLTIDWSASNGKVSISFDSENPFLSAFVVNDLGRELARIDRQLRQTKLKTTVDLFVANSHRLESRWKEELPQAASIHQIEGKNYWLSSHFPSVDFWLKKGETLPPFMINDIRQLENRQEEYLLERLKIVYKVRTMMGELKNPYWKYEGQRKSILSYNVGIYKARFEFINHQIQQIDQQLQSYYDQLPEEMKNEDWIMIDEEASTNYITKNYFLDLHTTVKSVTELHQDGVQFSIIADSSRLSKMPNLLIYFWLMVGSVLTLFTLEIIYDKFGLNEKR
ncbi:MAG: hypothetical protein KDD99_30815, partial [Bacteroidetes bacterium]|nr:hypothetical protein [Bacteroidota bacterium]